MKKTLIFGGAIGLLLLLFLGLRFGRVAPGPVDPVAGVRDAEGGGSHSGSNSAPLAKKFEEWQQAFAGGQVKFSGANREHVLALARERRVRMEKLIREHPRDALAEALSFSDYSMLPAEVQAIVERPFTVRGDLVILPVCPNPDMDPVERKRMLVANAGRSVQLLHGYNAFVEIRKPGSLEVDSFRAFLHGRKEGVGTKNGIPVQGIRLGDISAIRTDSLQVLTGQDGQWAKAELPNDHSAPGRDFLTGETIEDPVIAVAGGQQFHFANAENAGLLNRYLSQWDDLPGPHAGSQVLFQAFGGDGGFDVAAAGEEARLQASVWTETRKKVFFIRVDFPDKTGESVAQTVLSNKVNMEVSDIIRTMSYGKTWLECEVSEMVVRLPSNSSVYVPDDSGQLHDDARAAFNALNTGINLDDYDVIGVHFTSIGMSYGGLAGGGRQWIQNSTGAGLITHEFGHNYGLGHSSSWDTTNGTVFVDGTHTEYGDKFDIMGSGPYPQGEFHIQGRTKLNWMETNQWTDVTANGSGTYRLYRFDHRDAVLNQALRITKGADEYYWLGNRRLFTDNRYLQKGIYMVWERPGESRSWLIDTTPGSAAGKDDAGVVIGRTYSDTNAAVHITPTAQGGVSPNEWIDVRVNLGSFDGNQIPAGNISGPASTVARVNQTYSSAVTDGDGDTLAYQWDMGDGTVLPNVSSVTHHWSVGGTYTVTLIVSDMKGGVITNSMSVTVSDPLSNWTWVNEVTNITTTTLEDITSTGTNLLVVGRNVALLSNDGSNWVKSAGIGGNLIPLGAKWDGSQFVVVGQDYDFGNSVWVGAIKTSPDGTNWTQQRKEGPILRDLAFGNGRLVAVGDGGIVLTSTDGASWTIQDSTLTNGLDGVAFGAGKFVAVSDVSPRKSISSADGISWTASDVTDNANLAEIEYLRDRFVANGWYSKIRHSTDHGQSFLFQNQSVNYDTPAMTFGAGVFLAAGQFLDGPNDNKDLNAVSLDGVNWNEYVAPDQDNRTDATFYNGRFITVGANGSIWLSDPVSAPSLSPVIVNQPVDVIADQGDNVTFDVAATGTHPLTYQWRLNGTDVAGASGALLSLNDIQAVNGGGYTVVVSNSAGSITSAVANLVVQLTNVAAPANDLLVNAANLGYGSISDSNLGASTESGEAAPYGANATPKRTVWYKWVSPFIGRATGSVTQAGLYPTLGIYRHSGGGVSFGNLTKIAGFWGEGSVALDFEVEHGVTYYLQLDDYFGRAMTNFSLSFNTQPRRVIGLLGDLAFGNVTAGSSSVRTLTITNEGNADLRVSGVSLPAGFLASYSGTIAAGGSASVSVVFQPNVGSYGGTVAVHSDANGGVGQIVASGTGVLAGGHAVSPTSVSAPYQGSNFTATITMPANIQWGAFSTNDWISIRTPTNGVSNGTISVDIAPNYLATGRTGQVVIPPLAVAVTQAAAPFNDFLTNALNLDIGIAPGMARSITFTGATTGATVEANEPRAFESNTTPEHSVWYKWTAPANIRADFSVTRNGENVLLGVYTNNSGALAVDNLTKITGTWGNPTVSRNISALAGVTYYIQVDTYFGAEMPSFAFTATVSAPPANDDFANAIELFLTQSSNVFSGNTLSSSAEANEPNGTGAGNASLDRSVWYKWRATVDGDISATLERVGHGGTPVLAIYTANGTPAAVDNLTKLTGNWGQPTVTRTRTVTTDTIYYFQLDEYFGNQMDPYQFTLVVPDAISNLPPAIVQQPIGLTGIAGSTLNLSVVAGGGAPFSYQWKKDGANVSGATQSTLQLANVQSGDAGSYTVEISNATGSVTSSAANVVVSGAAPFITSQPGSMVLQVGAITNLTVTATGSAPLSYQWRKNGQEINGATSATLAIGGANVSHEGVYSVLVSNGLGSRASVASSVVVIDPAMPAAIARSLLVELLATDATAGESQWLNPGELGGVFNRQGESALVTDVNGTGIKGVTFDGTNDGYLGPVTISDLEGNSDRSIEVWAYNPALPSEETMVSLGHRGSTRRVVQLNFGNSGSWGAVTHWSDDLGWNGSTPSVSNWHHIVYTYSNQVAKVYVNGTVVNTKTLGGSLDTYAGEPIKVGFAEQSNGDKTLWYSGYLNTIRIHGGVLEASQVRHNFRRGPAKPIAAQQAPSISSQPSSLAVNALGTAQFTVAATGTDPLAYQWKKNGVNVSGANGSTLTINNVSTNDIGDYTVVVSNGAGSAASTVASLTVNRLTPAISWSSPGAVVYGTALGGGQLNASSATSGSYNYNPVAGTVLAAGAQTLNVELVPSNTSIYSNATASVTLAVNKAPLTIAADNKTREVGAANPALTLTYTGFVNGETNDVLTAQPSLNTAATAGSPAGDYPITVSGATAANYNITHVNGTLSVQNVPITITQEPQGKSVAPLRSALLSVTATSSATIAYQWQRGGVSISDATNSTLHLRAVTTNDVGEYRVVLSNGSSASTSSIATVSLNVGAPVIHARSGDLIAEAQRQENFAGGAFDENTGTYVVPAPNILQQFRNAAAELWQGNLTGAVAHVVNVGYEGVRFTDTNFNRTYIGIQPAETNGVPVSGWGVYLVDTNWLISALVEAPHPNHDFRTPLLSAEVLMKSGSRAFLLAGAHRHANGNQTADVAHITNSVFHVIHETWAGQNGENTAWQMHGYGTNNYPQFPADHAAILSTGEDGTNYMSANIVNLDAQLEAIGVATYAFTKNMPTNHPLNLQVNGAIDGFTFQPLGARSNDQGLVSRARGGTFVHLEFAKHLRTDPVLRTGTAQAIANAILATGNPPSISRQPADTNIYMGDPLTLSVAASGTPPLRYQWRRNGTALPGATNHVFTVGNANTNTPGSYDVEIRNYAGSVTSAPAAVVVRQLDPQVNWVGPSAITYGTALTSLQLNASAATSGSFAYTPVPGTVLPAGAHTLEVTFVPHDAGTYSNVTRTVNLNVNKTALQIRARNQVRSFGTANPPLTLIYTGFVNGETNDVLTAQPSVSTTATLSSVPGNYPITVTGGSASNYNITRMNGVLSIDAVPPAITQQPVGTNISAGENIVLTVVASGTPPLNYIWRRNGAVVLGGGSTLVVSNATFDNAGEYRVVVTNVVGSVQSQGATVTVQKLPQTITFGALPSLQPGQTNYNLVASSSSGLPVQFSVQHPHVAKVAGSQLTLRLWGTTDIVASQSGNETYLPAQPVTNRLFYAAPVAQPVGAPSVHVVHGRIDPPFTNYFVGSVGGGLTNSIHVGSNWIGSKLPASGLIATELGLPMVDGDRVLKYSTARGEFDVYHYFGTNWFPREPTLAGAEGFQLITDTAREWVQVAPPAGGFMSRRLTGSDMWATPLRMTSSNYLVTALLSEAPAGLKVVKFTNGVLMTNAFNGISWTDTNMSFPHGEAFLVSKENDVLEPVNRTFSAGSDLRLRITTEPRMYFQWRKDNTPIVGATNATLPLLNLAVADIGDYDVLVWNFSGSVTSSVVNIGIGDLPLISQQPFGFVKIRGENVTFHVTVTGRTPLHYQWFREQLPLADATNSQLTIPSVTRNHRGTYSVTVTNSAGSVRSSNALLRVLAPPRLESIIRNSLGLARLRFGDDDGFFLPTELANGFVIQASSDLRNWVTISTNASGLSPANGSFEFDDPGSSNRVRRFYRVYEH